MRCSTSESGQFDTHSVCFRKKKQMYVSLSCVFPVIDNKFRHTIVEVVSGSIRLSPRSSTATLTMLWQNSWSPYRTNVWKTDVNLLNLCISRSNSVCILYVAQWSTVVESNLQSVILNLNFSFFRHFETENNWCRYQEVFCRLFRTGILRVQSNITNRSLVICYYQLTSMNVSDRFGT